MDFDHLVDPSETLLRVAEVAAAYILVGLFIIGVFDLLLSIGEAFVAGTIRDPIVVVSFIDTALLLLIIVEVYQTVVASARDENVVRIVIIAALIAVARKIISFRPEEYASLQEALVFSVAIAILLLALVVALYVTRTTARMAESPEGPGSADEQPPPEKV